MKVGRLLLRAAVGGFFVGHGSQKLFGAFGGGGLKETAENFEAMGMKPGKVNAVAAGAGELFGGAGVALGYRTPLASSAIVATMITAINRVHGKNGPWATNGGYEYNAVLLAAAVTLAEVGPGAFSLDALRGKERVGAKWGLLALALGGAGAAGAQLLAQSRADSEPEAAPVVDVAPVASFNGSDPAASAATETVAEVNAEPAAEDAGDDASADA